MATSTFGSLPYIPSAIKTSNLYVDSQSFVVQEENQRFYTKFPVNARNLSVFQNGILLAPKDWMLHPSVGFQSSELILHQPVELNDYIFIHALVERAGNMYDRKQYVEQVDTQDKTLIECPFDLNFNAVQVYVNRLLMIIGEDFHAEGLRGIRFVRALSVGDEVLVTTDFPVQQPDLRIDWTAIDNLPEEIREVITENIVRDIVSEVMSTVLQSDEDNHGSDFITFEVGKSVRDRLNEISNELENMQFDNLVKKNGDSGLGIMSGEEWRLSSKHKHFRLYYDSPLDNSSFTTDAEGNIVAVVKARETLKVTREGIEHEAYGGSLDNHFFPKSGMLLRGIGSYALWAGTAEEGTIMTPSGWAGSWKVMSSAYRSLNNKICLMMRIV